MLTLKQYLHEYQKSHVHPTNIKIHTICVPLIVYSIIGILYSLPSFYNGIGAAELVLIFAMVYYFILSKKYFLLLLPYLAACYLLCILIAPTGQLLSSSIAIFVLSWIGQFYGHKLEGKKPSFFQDLTFLLVGPMWVAKKVLKLND